MSVRTYIGARYVPRFMGTYDPTQEYEALDVVDNGSGTSYIATKIVPPGTPLTDTSFWALYGASSGAIIALQNDMIQAQNDIINIQLDVGLLQGSVLGLQNDVDNLKTLERNIIVIGNSYVGRGVTNILEKSFKNAYRFGGDGTGFLTYIHHTTTFEDQLDTAIADASIDKDTITDVIFVSAMGDERALYERSATFTADLMAAINACKAKIDANYPNVQRIVVTLAETRDIAYLGNYPYSDLFAVHRAFKSVCPACSVEYIGWSGWCAMFNSSYVEADHFHPTIGGGAEVIGAWLADAYFGNAEYKIFDYQVGAACPFKYSASSTAMVICDISPDMVVFNIRRIDTTNGAAVTLAGGDQGILDCSGMAVPPPAPCHTMSVNAGVRNIIAGTGYGDQVDFLVLGVTGDTHGILTINNSNNPKLATMPSSRLAMDIFESFVYIP